ncbi:zinc-binding dehydrogenase [Cohnella sp. GCM10020058]|uniref:zinc-dependent alcohol dehydrogenase n=1 Tax=Cohnella sp. GCM10020058 TaxID=3317330 RepID=UPI00362CB268
METVEQPVPGPGEVLIRVEAVGICGSELEGYRGHSAVRRAPLVMGHEFAGEVVAASAEAAPAAAAVTVPPTATGTGAAADLVGRRVVVNPLLACGRCPRCLEGRPNVCRERRIVGIHLPGAFAEYVAVPASSVTVVPDGMDAALASLAEPLAVCVHAIRLARADNRASNDGLLVLGAGPIGLLTLQAALALGAPRVLVSDRLASRLAFVRALGGESCAPEEAESACRALFGEDGPEAVVDCVGVAQTRETAVRLASAGGRVVLVGLGQDESPMPMNLAVRKELSLLGSYTYSEGDFAEAVGLLASGAIRMEGWTGACALEEAAAAFEALDRSVSPYGKIIVKPNGGVELNQ